MKPNANMALSNDEHSMIFSNHFGIHFLPKGQGSTPTNDYGLIFTCTVQMTSAFVLAMAGMVLPMPFYFLCWACVVAIILCRVVTVIIFLMAVIKGRYMNAFYRSSFFFWGWWPFWLLITTVGATILGAEIGGYVWKDCLGPYFELKKLQKYSGINPDHVPGSRIQDAGLVDFTNLAEMDRAKGGCYLSKGNTYCIAPIVNGGEVQYGLAGTPRTGSFDYFAVGTNCCPCPNRDFQCGEWNNPIASGGIRSLDIESRPYYKLALDDWEASYQKKAKNPIFFEWVQDAEWKWKGMWNQALHIGCLSIACGFSIALSIAFLLDKFLQILWQNDIVSPRACFAPPGGYDSLVELLLPKMYYRYQQEQAEIAAMPVSAEWKPQRGPGSGGDDKQVAQEYGANENSMTGQMYGSFMTPPGAQLGSTGPPPFSTAGLGY